MKREFKTVSATANNKREVNDVLNKLATALYNEKYEVISHSIYKDDHDPYTFIISVLAIKDTFQ